MLRLPGLRRTQIKTMYQTRADRAENLSGLSGTSFARLLNLTLPNEQRQRHHRLLQLAAALRTMDPRANPSKYIGLVHEWHRVGVNRGVIGADHTPDDSAAEFLDSWGRVDRDHPLISAWAAAMSPGNPLPGADSLAENNTRVLAAVCRELARRSAPEPFFLSHRNAGSLIGCDWRTAGKRLSLLCAVGLIEVAQNHTTTRATRYRWVGEHNHG